MPSPATRRQSVALPQITVPASSFSVLLLQAAPQRGGIPPGAAPLRSTASASPMRRLGGIAAAGRPRPTAPYHSRRGGAPREFSKSRYFESELVSAPEILMVYWFWEGAGRYAAACVAASLIKSKPRKCKCDLMCKFSLFHYYNLNIATWQPPFHGI